jgi:hypothetical protein
LEEELDVDFEDTELEVPVALAVAVPLPVTLASILEATLDAALFTSELVCNTSQQPFMH